MRYIFLLVLFPFLASGQNQLTETHTAIFFKKEMDRESRIALLRKHSEGELRELSEFHYKSVIIVSNGTVNKQALEAETMVEYISAVHSNAKKQFVTHRSNFFVLLNDESDLEMLKREAQQLGLTFVKQNEYMPTLVELNTDKHGMHALDAVNALKASGNYRLVSPNLMHTVSDCSVDDPRYNRQWHLKNDGSSLQGNGTIGADIDAEAAWGITTGSSDVTIVIVDSGIDTLHPELLGKLLPGYDAMEDGTNGYPTPNYDSDGHGTACAGIAAANSNNTLGVAGVCQDCNVVPIRVFNYEVILGEVQPWSETAFFLNAMTWQTQNDIDVSSNSWAVPDILLSLYPGSDTLVNAVIDEVVDNARGGLGVPMLFSSGNDGVTDSIPLWPARYEKTIAVGATSMCDEHKNPSSCDGENWAGNWGEGLDVSAPGVKVATIDMLGSNGFGTTEYYNTFNGTSAACPNAAGAMGLLLSEFPQMPSWMARKVMCKGAEKVGGYDYGTWKENGNWSKELGYGRINAYNSLVYGATSVDQFSSVANMLIETHADHHVIRVNDDAQLNWILYDLNGRSVMRGSASGSIQLLHAGLGAGLYALSVEREGQLNTVKLVIP